MIRKVTEQSTKRPINISRMLKKISPLNRDRIICCALGTTKSRSNRLIPIKQREKTTIDNS